MQKKVVYVFDLDYTLLRNAEYNEDYKKGIYDNLEFIPNAKKVLCDLGKEKCILLTFDRYGDQMQKLKYLQVDNYFHKIIVVTEKLNKRTELDNINNNFEKVIVIGDRYDEGELFHAVEFGMKTVCVDLPGGMYSAKDHYDKFDKVIKNESEYHQILEV